MNDIIPFMINIYLLHFATTYIYLCEYIVSILFFEMSIEQRSLDQTKTANVEANLSK